MHAAWWQDEHSTNQGTLRPQRTQPSAAAADSDRVRLFLPADCHLWASIKQCAQAHTTYAPPASGRLHPPRPLHVPGALTVVNAGLLLGHLASNGPVRHIQDACLGQGLGGGAGGGEEGRGWGGGRFNKGWAWWGNEQQHPRLLLSHALARLQLLVQSKPHIGRVAAPPAQLLQSPML